MIRYYSLKNILKKNAQYNMIFGERSNGKTYSVLYYALENYLLSGDTLAVIRRYREDFRGKRGQAYFESLEHNGNNKNVITTVLKTNSQTPLPLKLNNSPTRCATVITKQIFTILFVTSIVANNLSLFSNKSSTR